jgi:hypothetical protein
MEVRSKLQYFEPDGLQGSFVPQSLTLADEEATSSE